MVAYFIFKNVFLGQDVKCHHGPRECAGNRLLTCMFKHYGNSDTVKFQIFNCFMAQMMNKQKVPADGMRKCLDGQSSATPAVVSKIISCAEGGQATELQRKDQAETGRIAPKFVPFIGINGHGNINMQATQTIMTEKVRAWNTTLNRIPPQNVPQNQQKCNSPPDFWCSDADITRECYTAQGCSEYLRTIYGKPVHIKVLYGSGSDAWQKYFTDYLKPNFVRQNSFSNDNRGKYLLEIEPMGNTITSACNANCQKRECIMSKVADAKERTDNLFCLIENENTSDLKHLWTTKCSNIKNPEARDSVVKCTESQEWRQLAPKRAQLQKKSIRPEPASANPWIILNGYSIRTVQNYASILHRMICLWYRGPGHDREFCGRCEYEPTHC